MANQVDLCLTLFPWADFRSTKAAVKAHTILDLRGAIRVFVHITSGKVHDVNVLDLIYWPAGSIVVIDRGYLDFARLHALHQRQVSFVIRAKDNTRYTWAASREVDKSTGLRSDQSILLATAKSKLGYPDRLRRVSYRDPETDKYLVFLANRFDLPALTIAEIYRKRWMVELFFKWIKQNLSIKHFFGTSINAVKSQLWIAVCVSLIVMIARKRLNLPASPQILLNIFEDNMFEKIPIDQLVTDALLRFDEVPDAAPLALEFRHTAAYSLRPPRGLTPTGWPWGPFADDTLIDARAAERLPLTRLFDGIGLLVARSSWSPDATYVTFKAGDNFWSHSHLDQGAFTIYKGGELAIDSGAYAPSYGSDHHMNYSYQSIAHNLVTVTDPADTLPAPKKDKSRPIANDGGQRRVGSGWGIEAAPLDLAEWEEKLDIYHTGRIAQSSERDGITLAVADVTPAYTNRRSGQGTFSHRTRRVERYYRSFAYDRIGDVVVVWDDLRASDPALRKRWLLHSVEEPTLEPGGFGVPRSPGKEPGRAGGNLEARVLWPERAVLNKIDRRPRF